jgi:hypothetical protein
MQLRLSQSFIALVALATLACNAAPTISRVFSIETRDGDFALDRRDLSFVSLDSRDYELVERDDELQWFMVRDDTPPSSPKTHPVNPPPVNPPSRPASPQGQASTSQHVPTPPHGTYDETYGHIQTAQGDRLSHPASVIETIPHTANPRTRLENYRQQTIDKNPHMPTTVGIASDGHTEHYGTSVPPSHGTNPLPQGEAKGIRKQRTMDAYDANRFPRAKKPNDCQWGPGQCAEFKTIPPLVDRHSTTNKHIDTLTVNTKSGEPMKMCPNCEKMAETMTNRIPGLSIHDRAPGGKKFGPKRSNTI